MCKVVDMDKEYQPKFRKWLDMKEKYPEAIILFRCGDFYECLGDDAEKVARVCGITLSTWGSNPMRCRAGFPHHALDIYLPKLVRDGYKLAIVDEYEDPKRLKKLAKQDN